LQKAQKARQRTLAREHGRYESIPTIRFGGSIMSIRKASFGILLGLCVFATSAIAQVAPDRLFPITDVVPEYPVPAIRDGEEGWVYVQFTVTASGGVRDVRVSDAEPPQVFDAAAISAAQQFRFEPQTNNGTPADVADVGYVFRFDLTETVSLTAPEGVISRENDSMRLPPIELISTEDFIPLVAVAPSYPDQALEQEVSGWVIVRFTVTEMGAVEDAEVVDAEPPGIFDAAALRATQGFEYEPRLSDGRAVDVRGVYHMFKFRPST
jgi:TonB family protein